MKNKISVKLINTPGYESYYIIINNSNNCPVYYTGNGQWSVYLDRVLSFTTDAAAYRVLAICEYFSGMRTRMSNAYKLIVDNFMYNGKHHAISLIWDSIRTNSALNNGSGYTDEQWNKLSRVRSYIVNSN